MESLRIGLSGVGNIDRLNALVYSNTPNAEIYAVCDVNEKRVHQRAAEWGAKKFTEIMVICWQIQM